MTDREEAAHVLGMAIIAAAQQSETLAEDPLQAREMFRQGQRVARMAARSELGQVRSLFDRRRRDPDFRAGLDAVNQHLNLDWCNNCGQDVRCIARVCPTCGAEHRPRALIC